MDVPYLTRQLADNAGRIAALVNYSVYGDGGLTARMLRQGS